jgi:hypothetical protein
MPVVVQQPNADEILKRIRTRLRTRSTTPAPPDRADHIEALLQHIRQQLHGVESPAGLDAPVAETGQAALPEGHSRELAEMSRQIEAAHIAHRQFGQLNPRLPGLHNRAIQLVKQTMRRSLSWYTRPLHQNQSSVIQALQHAMRVLQAHDRVLQGESPIDASAVHKLRQQNADLQQQLEAQRAELSALRDELRRAVDSLEAPMSAKGRDTR